MAVAELGYMIDSSGAVVATKNLDAMTAAAIRSERAENVLSNTTKSTSSNVKSMSTAVDVLSRELTSTAQSATIAKTSLAGIGAELVATQREAALYRAEMDAIRAQFNPLFAASKQYEAQLENIASAERMGAISANEAADARARAASIIDGANSQMVRFGAVTGNSTGQIANLGAQLNDIGVMLAAGQSPLQLAVQQGTQINQVFAQMGGGKAALQGLAAGFMSMVNPMSLATIGTIAGVAALSNWAFQSDDAKDKAKDLADQATELTSVARSYIDAIDAAAISTVDLVSKFGMQAESMRELYNLQVSLQRLQLAQTMSEFASQAQTQYAGLASDLEDIVSLSKLAAENTLSHSTAQDMLNSKVSRLRDEFGLGVGQALALSDAIQDIAAASTLDEQARAAQKFGEELVKAADGGADIPPEMVRLAIEAGVAADTIRQLEGALLDAAAASSSIQIPGSGGGRADPRQFTNTDEFRAQLAAQDAWKAPRKPKGRKKGGGRKKEDPYQDDLQALIESLRTERETIDAWYMESDALLNDRRATELLTAQEHNAAKLALEAEYQERLSGIRGAYQGSALDQTQQFMGEMAAALQGGNDKMQRIAQTFASIEALINAYRAYNQVIADPTLPWYAKIPAAAGVLAAGMKTVKSIKSLSGGGGGSGGGSASSAPSAQTQAPQQMQRAIIQINGNRSRFTIDEINDIIMQLQKEAKDGVIIEGFVAT